MKDMLEIITLILKSLGNTLASFLYKLIDVIGMIFQYLNKNSEIKDKKTKKIEIEKTNKEIEKVCDEGSLDDLFDKFIKTSIIMITLFLIGCTTNIEIQTVKNWEGHYMDEKDFHKATDSIKLERGESIWVLSNRSLKRILIQKQEK